MQSLRLSAYLIVLLIITLVSGVAGAQSYDDLLKAVRDGDRRAVETLLNRGMDPNTADADGLTLLMLAAREGQVGVATLLVERKANVRLRSPHGDSALMMAALAGRMPIVELLVTHGAEVSHSGWAPLHYAAFDGHGEVIRYLLKHDADVDAVAPNGYTALM